MTRWMILAVALAFGAAGCSKKEVVGPPAPLAGQKAKADAMLAYSHQMDVDLPLADIAPRIAAIQQACTKGTYGACNVLTVEQGSSGGSVAVRIVPEGVESLTGIASRGGKVSSRRTSAEDISQAVHDTQRDRDQLEAYAKRLDEIAARKDLGVSDLITVSREQAEVAEKRRALMTASADQQHRLDTNYLRISFTDPHARAGRRDFGEIGDDMLDSASEGIGDALRLLAGGLPFLVIAFPLALLWWALWRRATKRWRRQG